MTTAIFTQPFHTAAFLFGDSQDSVGALARSLDETGVVGTFDEALKHLSRAGYKAVGRQIAGVAHGMLDLDLGDLVVGGWCKFADLVAAAKRTVAAADSKEIVELSKHTITYAHHPHVDVLVNDARVATVQFDLAIKFVVKGLSGTISNGHLVALHSGSCDVAGSLAAEGRQLAKREAHLELPLLVRLGDGVPLLRSRSEHPPPEAAAQQAAPTGAVVTVKEEAAPHEGAPTEAAPTEAAPRAAAPPTQSGG
jgi:hypothetical protein